MRPFVDSEDASLIGRAASYATASRAIDEIPSHQ